MTVMYPKEDMSVHSTDRLNAVSFNMNPKYKSFL